MMELVVMYNVGEHKGTLTVLTAFPDLSTIAIV